MKKLEIKSNETMAKYFKELLNGGWLDRRRATDENNNFTGGYNYTIYESKKTKGVDPYSQSLENWENSKHGKTGKHNKTNKSNKTNNINNTNKMQGIFSKAVELYFSFYEDLTGIQPKFDGVAGSSMKKLIKNLRQMSKEKNDDDIIKGLKFIFKNWNKLSPFIRKQIEVRQINSNLNTIILELKAKKNTQSVDNDLKNYLSL